MKQIILEIYYNNQCGTLRFYDDESSFPANETETLWSAKFRNKNCIGHQLLRIITKK